MEIALGLKHTPILRMSRHRLHNAKQNAPRSSLCLNSNAKLGKNKNKDNLAGTLEGNYK